MIQGLTMMTEEEAMTTTTEGIKMTHATIVMDHPDLTTNSLEMRKESFSNYLTHA
jgi:hypothetical protein